MTVKLVNVSLRRQMEIVGLVAFNLATARFLLEHDRGVMIGVIPIGLVLQYAVIRVARERGRRRAFWCGFLAVGLVAMFSFVGAMRQSVGGELVGNRVSKQMMLVSKNPIVGGAEMLSVWLRYETFVRDTLGYKRPAFWLVTIVVSLPQIATAAIGGFAAWLAWRPWMVARGAEVE